MAEIARRMGCSLRTLYGIAPSKDELVLIVLDRQLHQSENDAMQALDSLRSERIKQIVDMRYLELAGPLLEQAMYMQQCTDQIGAIADNAQRVAHRLQLMLA